MSILFNDATPDFYDQPAGELHPSLIPCSPVTVSFWYKIDVLGIQHATTGLYDSATAFDYIQMYLGTGDSLRTKTRDNANDEFAVDAGPTDSIINQWHHGCGIWHTSALREVFTDFEYSNATETTDITPDPLPDRVSIGHQGTSSPAKPFSGNIEDVAWWDVVLHRQEVRMLSLGVSPLLIRPRNLRHYFPLTTTAHITDVISGSRLIVSGTPKTSASYPFKSRYGESKQFFVKAVPIRKRFAVLSDIGKGPDPSYTRGYARNAAESANPGAWKGLVGAWVPMLGSTGLRLRDVSGYGNHGTLTAMDPVNDWIIHGGNGRIIKPTPALDFDNDLSTTQEYVDIAGIEGSSWDFASDNVTLLFWCGPTGSGASGSRLVAKSDTDGTDDYSMHLSATNRINFRIRTGGSLTSLLAFDDTTPFDGTPRHVVGRYDGVNMEIFENVILNDQSAAKTGIIDNGGTGTVLRIGNTKGSSNAARMFQGTMWTVKIYNRALTLEEIREDYYDPLGFLRLKTFAIAIPPFRPVAAVLDRWLPGSTGVAK